VTSLNLKSIADRIAIREVLERYCRGIDRLDAELINEAYWDEAIDDHGASFYKGPGKDFAKLAVPMLFERYRCAMHCLHQSLIELHGNRANVETYFVAYACQSLKQAGRETIEISGGRYVDVMEERNGEWRIRDRVVVIEWGRLDKDLEPLSLPPEANRGRRDRNDIAYGADCE
jgi:hypothetical protein